MSRYQPWLDDWESAAASLNEDENHENGGSGLPRPSEYTVTSSKYEIKYAEKRTMYKPKMKILKRGSPVIDSNQASSPSVSSNISDWNQDNNTGSTESLLAAELDRAHLSSPNTEPSRHSEPDETDEERLARQRMEREKRYKEARSKIFGDIDASDSETPGSGYSTSSSDVSGHVGNDQYPRKHNKGRRLTKNTRTRTPPEPNTSTAWIPRRPVADPSADKSPSSYEAGDFIRLSRGPPDHNKTRGFVGMQDRLTFK